MRKIFHKTDILDKRACEKFLLSEEILMENAARGIAEFIKKKARNDSNILFLCGAGNNGADGYAAARMLSNDFNVFVLDIFTPKTDLAKLQLSRAKAAKVTILQKLPKKLDFDIYVDCIFGSGQKDICDKQTEDIITAINAKNGLKIACDIPTNIRSKNAFKADFTLAMGSLKSVLFEDFAKDFVGETKVCDLGVSNRNFETESDTFLLEKSDLVLPKREQKNSNKGDFGHLAIVSGRHSGAAILSGLSALTMGVGLVSLLTDKKLELYKNPSLMQTSKLPPKTTAICIGMGLGDIKIDMNLLKNLPVVFDADMCYDERILNKINNQSVITPHPKEFASLLEIFGFGRFGVDEIQQNRFEFARKFSANFEGILVLKGANTIVAKNGVLYACNFGTQALAKGGSGDVLAGVIGALLAQQYEPLEAAKNGVLAHALAASNFEGNSYSMTAEDLTQELKWL